MLIIIKPRVHLLTQYIVCIYTKENISLHSLLRALYVIINEHNDNARALLRRCKYISKYIYTLK